MKVLKAIQSDACNSPYIKFLINILVITFTYYIFINISVIVGNQSVNYQFKLLKTMLIVLRHRQQTICI